MKITRLLRCPLLQLNRIVENKSKTIYALSSGHIRAAVAIIRVSGSSASKALNSMTKLDQGNLFPRNLYYTGIKHPMTGERIDNGMAVWFPGPHSFTGEDVCEFHIHGGPAVIVDVLRALSQIEEFVPAEPGEFSKRAFLNGKLDLTAAEGLADLLNAETSAQRKLALRQASGDLKRLYASWRETLIKCVAHVEAFIDFGEEEHIEDNVLENVNQQLTTLREAIIKHLKDGRTGERLRNGLHVAIVGEPNVGKSSLLNILCKRPAAIVAPIPGTTRDTLEVPIDLSGYPILLMDTAGIRQTDDIVEKEGVRRSKQKILEADVVVIMAEAEDVINRQKPAKIDQHGQSHTNELQESLGAYLDKILEGLNMEQNETDWPEIIILINKIDTLVPGLTFNVETDEFLRIDSIKWRQRKMNVCWISCIHEHKLEDFLERLTTTIKNLCGQSLLSSSSPTLTHQRHRHLVNMALNDLDNYFNSHNTNLVMAADYLRRILRHIGSLTGQVTTEEILDCVFRDFCIGK